MQARRDFADEAMIKHQLSFILFRCDVLLGRKHCVRVLNLRPTFPRRACWNAERRTPAAHVDARITSSDRPGRGACVLRFAPSIRRRRARISGGEYQGFARRRAPAAPRARALRLADRSHACPRHRPRHAPLSRPSCPRARPHAGRPRPLRRRDVVVVVVDRPSTPRTVTRPSAVPTTRRRSRKQQCTHASRCMRTAIACWPAVAPWFRAIRPRRPPVKAAGTAARSCRPARHENVAPTVSGSGHTLSPMESNAARAARISGSSQQFNRGFALLRHAHSAVGYRQSNEWLLRSWRATCLPVDWSMRSFLL